VTLTADQEARLRRAFGLFDMGNRQLLGEAELQAVVAALDAEESTSAAEMIRAYGAGQPGLSCDGFLNMLRESALFRFQSGRHYVALSLLEAEHLRAVMHARRSGGVGGLGADAGLIVPGNAGASVALWHRHLSLGRSAGFRASSRPQFETALQCYRFVDSEVEYDDSGLMMLLRAIQGNSLEDRQTFFLDVRQCRRRRQAAVDQSPVAQIFTVPDEYSFLEHKSVLARVRHDLLARGMLAYDAFKAFNASRTGLLTCSELAGGLDWLGLRFSVEQIHDLMRKLANDNEGVLTYGDFKAAFGSGSEAEEARALLGDDEGVFEVVAPRPVPELFDAAGAARGAAQQTDLTEDVLNRYKVAVVRIKNFAEVWNSQGTGSSASVSLWGPDMSQSRFKRNRARVCLGFYANTSFKDPSSDRQCGAKYYVEVSDTSGFRVSKNTTLDQVVDHLFPHPLRFKQVWHMTSRSGRPVYAWRPVAPDDHVALGMACTTTEDPPPVTAVRCVPRQWTQPAAPGRQVWNDTGAGGGRPGSFWEVNSMGLVQVVAGHDAPRENCYELVTGGRIEAPRG